MGAHTANHIVCVREKEREIQREGHRERDRESTGARVCRLERMGRTENCALPVVAVVGVVTIGVGEGVLQSEAR